MWARSRRTVRVGAEPSLGVASLRAVDATSEGMLEADGEASALEVFFEGRLSGELRWLDWVPDSMTTRMYTADYARLAKMRDRQVR